MTLALNNLNSVLTNIQGQQKSMNIAREQAEIVGRTVSQEVQDAITVLVKAFPENPVQVIGRIIGARLQLESLDKTQVEVDVLIAGVQTLISNEELLATVEKQVEVNAQPQAPLSDAAGTGQSLAANEATGKGASAQATGSLEGGDAQATSDSVNGVAA